MYEEFDKQQLELKLLKAKDVVFRFVSEYLGPIKLNDSDPNLYLYDYCESLWERAFTVLEIEDDAIEEFEFYKLWEENNRKIWAAHGNKDEMPNGWKAQWLYEWNGSGMSKNSKIVGELND